MWPSIGTLWTWSGSLFSHCFTMSEERPGIPRLGWVIAFLAVSTLLGVAFSNLKNTRPYTVPGHLQKISEVPAFTLTDQTGRTVTLADLKGKIWVANFIFSRCKGPCPLSTLRMAELNKRLARARKEVQLISFTVDPDHDTPTVLTEYAKPSEADPAHWQFLTGPSADINDIVVKGLLQPLAKEPDGTPAHSTRFVIVDANGWLRGYQDSADPEVLQKLMIDLGDILRESKSTNTK